MRRALLIAAISLMFATVARSEVKVTVDHNDTAQATAAFKFKNVPSPAKENAARNAKISIVQGTRDDMGGELDKITDGKLPAEQDQPEENFFFAQNTDGGRLLIDLGKAIDIAQVNTYSWHPDTRGPQVYRLYASDGADKDFSAKPPEGRDLTKAGWKLIATVDTRPKQGEGGGQYGVNIADPAGSIGKYRYLLLDASRTEADDPFGNTFYSEITVVEKK
jgi:hypothetical protein